MVHLHRGIKGTFGVIVLIGLILLGAMQVVSVAQPSIQRAVLASQSCSTLSDPAEIPSPNLIDFDNVSAGTNISTIYEGEYGVIFGDRTASVVAWDHPGPHSPPLVAQSEPGTLPPEEAQLRMYFTSPQTHVGMYVGNGYGAEAVLTTYDANGTFLSNCGAYLGTVPGDHNEFMGVYDPDGRIRYVRLQYVNETEAESIDDLYFTYAPPQPPTPTHTPVPPTPTSVPPSPTPTEEPVPGYISAYPRQIAPGGTLNVRAHGFPPGSNVQVQLQVGDEIHDLQTAQADGNGVVAVEVSPEYEGEGSCKLILYHPSKLLEYPLECYLAMGLDLSPSAGPTGTIVTYFIVGGNCVTCEYRVYAQVPWWKAVAGGRPNEEWGRTGKFVLPSNILREPGETIKVRAYSFSKHQDIWVGSWLSEKRTNIFGAAEADFLLEDDSPPPTYTLTNLQFPINDLAAGNQFEISGQISPPPLGPLSEYQIIPQWQTGEGKVLLIGDGPAQIAPNGQFVVPAHLPSYLTGDAESADAGGQIGVLLNSPGNAPQLLFQEIDEIWAITPLKVRVVDAETKQEIPGAKVSLVAWEETVQAGQLGQVANEILVDTSNQVSDAFGGDLTEEEQWAILLQKAFCQAVPIPADQNALDLINPSLDMSLLAPSLDGLVVQSTIFDLGSGPAALANLSESASHNGKLHYRLTVDAIDQGYGVVDSLGLVKTYSLLVDYNPLQGTYHRLSGEQLPNPLTIELSPFSSGNQSQLGPLPYVAFEGLQLLPGGGLPTFGTYYSLLKAPNTTIPATSSAEVLVFLSPGQRNKLGENGLKLYVDGAWMDDFDLQFDPGIDCDKLKGVVGQSAPLYQARASISNPHKLAAGFRNVEIRAQLKSGEAVAYDYRLKIDDLPPNWFAISTPASRSASWKPEETTLFTTWLTEGNNSEDWSTTAAETDETGPLVNRTQPQMTLTYVAKANGHKQGYSSGGVRAVALNRQGQGIKVGYNPTVFTALHAPTRWSLSPDDSAAISGQTITYGPITEQLVPKIQYDIPGFTAGIPFVAEVVAGGSMSYQARVTYGGSMTIQDDGSIVTEASVFPVGEVVGGLWIRDYLLSGFLHTGEVRLEAQIRSGLPVIYNSQTGVSTEGKCFQYSSLLRWYSGTICLPWWLGGGCWKEETGTENLFGPESKPQACELPFMSIAEGQQDADVPRVDMYLASNGYGQVMAIWPAARDRLATSVLDGDTWSPPQLITTGLGAGAAKVAFLAPDRALAVWVETDLTEIRLQEVDLDDTIKAQRIAYSLWDGSSWSPAQALTTPSLGEGGVALGVCPEWRADCPQGGSATVAWQRNVSADFTSRQIRLYAATYENGTWGEEQPVDPDSTFTDILPQVAYYDGGPLVVWIRDFDTDLTDLTSRRIALRLLRDGQTLISNFLPDTIAEMAMQVDGNDNLYIAFTTFADPGVALTNERPLWAAKFGCQGEDCGWQVHQLVDPVGRTLYAEGPLVSYNESGQGIITFRGTGFGGTDEVRDYDTPGMVTGFGELAQVTTDFSGPTVVPSYLTADGAVNWMPAAAYDPLLNATIATATKGPAAAGVGADLTQIRPQTASQLPAPELPITTTATSNQPDFVVQEVTPASPFIFPGETPQVTVLVTNQGQPWQATDGETVALVATWDGEAGFGTFAAEFILDNLGAGEVSEITLDLAYPPGAIILSHDLYVEIIPSQPLLDSNGDNNQMMVTMGGLPVPTGLYAGAEPGSNLVFLNWTPVEDGRIAGYRIWRQEGDGEWQPAGTAFNPGWVDLNASQLTSYRYALTAYSFFGFESDRSDFVSVSVPGSRLYMPMQTRAQTNR